MKNIALVVAAMMMAMSCGLIKPQVVYVNRDSTVTVTNTVTKDSIVHVPGDTIRIQIPCDKDTVYIVKGKASSSTVQVKKGVVSVQNNCDEKDIIITKLRDQISRYETSVSDSSKVEIRTVKHVPTIYKVFAYGFWILASAIAALFITNQNIWILVVAAMSNLIKIITKKKKKE